MRVAHDEMLALDMMPGDLLRRWPSIRTGSRTACLVITVRTVPGLVIMELLCPIEGIVTLTVCIFTNMQRDYGPIVSDRRQHVRT